MNREIKFRARAIQDGQWIVGDLIHKRYNGDEEVIIQEPNGCGTDCDINTVGQFTGLKDKNGQEIYEGDVIQSFDSNGKPIRHSVEYDCTEAKFVAILAGHPKYYFGGDISQRWIKEFEKEVIGNIHDNQELTKEGCQ